MTDTSTVAYRTFSPDHEVMGRALLPFIKSINHDHIQPFLEKHNLTDVEPDNWYPLQAWLDVLSDIANAAAGQAMLDFVSIGIKMFEFIPLPPEILAKPYEEVIFMHDDMYKGTNRATDVGGYTIEKLGDKHLKITVRVPYPDDFVYGSLYGEAKKFMPEETDFLLRYSEPSTRREQGAEHTVFEISWE